MAKKKNDFRKTFVKYKKEIIGGVVIGAVAIFSFKRGKDAGVNKLLDTIYKHASKNNGTADMCFRHFNSEHVVDKVMTVTAKIEG